MSRLWISINLKDLFHIWVKSKPLLIIDVMYEQQYTWKKRIILSESWQLDQ